MYVSDWPKMPNTIPRPNLGGDSTFFHHRSLGRGILSFVPTWGILAILEDFRIILVILKF